MKGKDDVCVCVLSDYPKIKLSLKTKTQSGVVSNIHTHTLNECLAYMWLEINTFIFNGYAVAYTCHI